MSEVKIERLPEAESEGDEGDEILKRIQWYKYDVVTCLETKGAQQRPNSPPTMSFADLSAYMAHRKSADRSLLPELYSFLLSHPDAFCVSPIPHPQGVLCDEGRDMGETIEVQLIGKGVDGPFLSGLHGVKERTMAPLLSATEAEEMYMHEILNSMVDMVDLRERQSMIDASHVPYAQVYRRSPRPQMSLTGLPSMLKRIHQLFTPCELGTQRTIALRQGWETRLWMSRGLPPPHAQSLTDSVRQFRRQRDEYRSRLANCLASWTLSETPPSFAIFHRRHISDDGQISSVRRVPLAAFDSVGSSFPVSPKVQLSLDPHIFELTPDSQGVIQVGLQPSFLRNPSAFGFRITPITPPHSPSNPPSSSNSPSAQKWRHKWDKKSEPASDERQHSSRSCAPATSHEVMSELPAFTQGFGGVPSSPQVPNRDARRQQAAGGPLGGEDGASKRYRSLSGGEPSLQQAKRVKTQTGGGGQRGDHEGRRASVEQESNGQGEDAPAIEEEVRGLQDEIAKLGKHLSALQAEASELQSSRDEELDAYKRDKQKDFDDAKHKSEAATSAAMYEQQIGRYREAIQRLFDSAVEAILCHQCRESQSHPPCTCRCAAAGHFAALRASIPPSPAAHSRAADVVDICCSGFRASSDTVKREADIASHGWQERDTGTGERQGEREGEGEG
ncbi:unnamed protein product [Vitrella brassicaformis CCMP3155]|uniref:Uncharacterized protein n=1 Tax=Vitrella brassicaformis (strain CCMP3155) TaxID=1169540 RepID=A0A0G4F722_VITBC|nr:unnamed protein product [Vitrella brassicaformis CCMP3155]|eukprot:CEM08319.1 unnamed protein product [Vitrella brassicaformis CCMP3155]